LKEEFLLMIPSVTSFGLTQPNYLYLPSISKCRVLNRSCISWSSALTMESHARLLS